MKNYRVRINVNEKKFSAASYETLGWVKANNKGQAIDLVYAAFQGTNFQGIEQPTIDNRLSGLVTPSSKKRLFAEIEK